MDVYGVGLLILGKSGIGKSECALDLILRGHRLVADDMVHIQKRSLSSVIGSGFEVIQHHMERRGLTTIIDVVVRNHLLKVMGYDSALEFEKKLLRKMEEREGDRFEAEGEVE